MLIQNVKINIFLYFVVFHFRFLDALCPSLLLTAARLFIRCISLSVNLHHYNCDNDCSFIGGKLWTYGVMQVMIVPCIVKLIRIRRSSLDIFIFINKQLNLLADCVRQRSSYMYSYFIIVKLKLYCLKSRHNVIFEYIARKEYFGSNTNSFGNATNWFTGLNVRYFVSFFYQTYT